VVTFTLIILSASIALAVILGRWSLVAATIGIVGAIAVYLVLNDQADSPHPASTSHARS
jgi:hypothetical protein